VAQSGERTRLVLNLKKASNYRAELQGKVLLVVIDSAAPPGANPNATAATAAATQAPVHFAESLNRNPSR